MERTGAGWSVGSLFVVALSKSQFHSSWGNGQKLIDSVYAVKKKKKKKKKKNRKYFCAPIRHKKAQIGLVIKPCFSVGTKTFWTFAMFFNMSIYDVITSHSQWRHFNTPTVMGQVDQWSITFFSPKPRITEGMYIFRKNNYCLPLATKHNSEIFSEFKEIKQGNKVSKKHKHP